MHRWRNLIPDTGLFLLLLCAAGTAAATTVNADGLHEQPWFLQSFLELRDDWQDAADQGRHFAVLWELKGCPACQRLHATLLSDPAIAAEMSRDFAVLQLNLIGSRRVTDFNGETYAENTLAQRLDIAGTPTLLIFAASIRGDDTAPREVLRITGVPEAERFVALLRFVSSGAYVHQDFEAFRRDSLHATQRPRS